MIEINNDIILRWEEDGIYNRSIIMSLIWVRDINIIYRHRCFFFFQQRGWYEKLVFISFGSVYLFFSLCLLSFHFPWISFPHASFTGEVVFVCYIFVTTEKFLIFPPFTPSPSLWLRNDSQCVFKCTRERVVLLSDEIQLIFSSTNYKLQIRLYIEKFFGCPTLFGVEVSVLVNYLCISFLSLFRFIFTR